ncbi:MAG: hypothetical protein LCH46_10765 [Proteobacteria bacterium]|nr:hypothetical protein [Pseudomonadota bacterium]
MQKVLPGTSREVLAFIVTHWQGLLRISAVPILIYVVAMWLQFRMVAGLYRQLAVMAQGQVDPAFWNSYLQNTGLMMICNMLGILSLGVLFTMIVRYHRWGEVNWLPLTGPVLKATFMTAMYGFGMMIVSILAYFVVALAILIPISIIVGLSNSAALAIILTPPAIIAIVAFLYWFMFRFFVGLPGVALGSTPDFFRDIWPLARGESWGVPLRMIVATLVVYVPLIIIAVVAFMAFAGNPENADIMQRLESSEAATFLLLADFMEGLSTFAVVPVLIFTPLIWFATLLLATAFQRFRARQEQRSA